MRFLLSVIAVCLVMITAKLYIPEVQADLEGVDIYTYEYNEDFKYAVKKIAKESIDEAIKKQNKELGDIFYKLPDNIKDMINTQCTVSGRAIYCPLKDRKNLVN